MDSILSKYLFHILFCLLLLVPDALLSENIIDEQKISEQKYDSLASLFYKSEMVCTYDSIAEQQIWSYGSRSIESFSQNLEYVINQDAYYETDIRKILIIVKNNVFSSIPMYIIRYAHDIHNAFGCTVAIVSVDGESPPQIRALIQSYATNLNGVVFVGDIVPAIYYHSATSTGGSDWDEDHFPCDLYYMDLDGTWHLKNDGSGWYNEHTGDVKPEIFVGRINTATMGRNEITELEYYFDRNHQYWTGQKVVNRQRALTFTGSDWNKADFRESVEPLYGSNYYDTVSGSGFTRSNYISYLQNSNYEFIQLACHSTAQYHQFSPSLYYYSISSFTTKQLGYNLFCCHACNWMSYSYSQCLGESYLYGQSNNSSALVLVGTTKTGGMLGFEDFYEPLGEGASIGTAFYLWWISHCGSRHTLLEKLWFYGMTILGDPLINFNYINDCDNILTLNGGEEVNNSMYYAQNKIKVQNYSITQGQHVTLSAPTIQITGPFVCNSSSSFIANPFDSCMCNTRSIDYDSTERKNKHSILHNKIASNIFYVFPNPAHDILIVSTNEKIANVAIYNFRGECMICSTQTEINVSNLPQGVYLLRSITVEGKVYQTKFIKQ